MASPAVLLAFALLVASANTATTYTSKYDNIDLDSILKSERLLNNYYKCLMDEGPCTPDGQELKSKLLLRTLVNLLRVTFHDSECLLTRLPYLKRIR